VVSAEPQHLRLDESARSEVEVVRVGSLQLAAIVAVGQHKLALAYWAAAVLFPVALRHFLRLRYALLQLCDEPLAPVSAEVAAHRLRQSNLSDTAHQENARLDGMLCSSSIGWMDWTRMLNVATIHRTTSPQASGACLTNHAARDWR